MLSILIKHSFLNSKSIKGSYLASAFLKEYSRCKSATLFHTASQRIIPFNGAKRDLRVTLLKQHTLTNLLTRLNGTSLDVNTKTLNNVILYKYDNTNFHRNIHLIGLTQLIGWALIVWMCYLGGVMEFTENHGTLIDFVKDNSLRLSLILCMITLGPLLYCGILFACQRTVKYIILHKGGERITMITHGPFKKSAFMTLPLNMIQTKTGRHQMKLYLPLKVKNTWFYYLLESRGKFLNEELFDSTVGIKSF